MSTRGPGFRGTSSTPVAIIPFVVALAAGSAHAEGRRAGTSELLQAIDLIQHDRCDVAVPLLRESYERGRFKNALWNLAECYTLLNRPDLAISTYREYIDHPRVRRTEARQASRAITELEGRLATVSVTGNVVGASLQLDGRPAGTIPGEVRVGPGEHSISVSSPGYGSWSQIITTGAGEVRRLEAELHPAPGRLHVASSTPRAVVWVDDEERGRPPWEGELEGGAHVVEVRGEGMRTARRQVVVLPGQRSEVSLVLEATRGTLAVGVDAAEARLNVGGEDRATSPFGPLEMSPGRYALAVTARGHRRWTGAVDVLDERTTRVDVDLASTEGLHQAWFWSLAALTVSAAAVGTTLVLLGREHLDAFEDDTRFVSQAESDLLSLASHRESGRESYDHAETYDISGWSLLGGAGLSLVATLVVGLLTRFTEEPSEAEVSIERLDDATVDPSAGGAP